TEEAIEKLLLVGLEGIPLGARLFQMEDVILGVSQAEELVFLSFLDDEEAADGEVDDGGGDVAHVHGIVDQGAYFAGSQIVGRLILRGDGTEARVAAAGPPPPEHQEEGGDREEERPVAAQIEGQAG